VYLINEARSSTRHASPYDVAVSFILQFQHVVFREHACIGHNNRLGYANTLLKPLNDLEHRFSLEGVALEHLMHDRKT